MKSNISIIMIIIMLSLAGCGKTEKPQGDTKKPEPKIESRYVTAKGGLRMRDKADTAGAILDTIPEGEKVELIEETGNAITISGATGKWSRIKWKDKTGWGFGGFLSDKSVSSADINLLDGTKRLYQASGPVMPGSPPSRLIMDKKMIAKYYGGSMSSHAYCLIEKTESRDNQYSITCSQRNLTNTEAGEYQIENSAEKIKNIIVTKGAAGRIIVDNTPYLPGSGM